VKPIDNKREKQAAGWGTAAPPKRTKSTTSKGTASRPQARMRSGGSWGPKKGGTQTSVVWKGTKTSVLEPDQLARSKLKKKTRGKEGGGTRVRLPRQALKKEGTKILSANKKGLPLLGGREV